LIKTEKKNKNETMSYGKDLKERTVKYRQAHGIKETIKTFNVSESAIRSWEKQCQKTGNLDKKPLNRKRRKTDPEKLRKDIRVRPDAFNRERAQRFGRTEEAIRLALKKQKITRKKMFYLQGKKL
jgi:transposase